jgi:hypothetical protein
MTSLPPLLCLLALASGGCNGGQPLHEPDPSWGRMIEQPRADTFAPNRIFADGAAMRVPPNGVVPMSPAETRGRDRSGEYRRRVPFQVNRDFIEKGRELFDVHCAVCHGIAGGGESAVAERLILRHPPSLVAPPVLGMAPGAIYEVIRDGYGFMGSLAPDLDSDARWEVVAYVQALQLSRHADVTKLPDDVRDALAKEAP